MAIFTKPEVLVCGAGCAGLAAALAAARSGAQTLLVERAPFAGGYRSLPPQEAASLLVVRRCHSAMRLAAIRSRVTATAMTVVQDDGTAAALAGRLGVTAQELDGPKAAGLLDGQDMGPYVG